MANEKTKVKAGKGLEWTLSMWDEKGFLLGIHFDRYRKCSKAQMDILKAALWDAAEKLDALADSKRNRACAKHALTVKVGAGDTAVESAPERDIHAELTLAAFHREVTK